MVRWPDRVSVDSGPSFASENREEVADLLQAALYGLDRAAEGGLDAVCKGGHDPFAGLEEPRDRAGDGVLDVVQAVGEGGGVRPMNFCEMPWTMLLMAVENFPRISESLPPVRLSMKV